MTGQTFRIPYGTSSLEFTLPPSMTADVAVSKPFPPLADPVSVIRQALAQPTGCPPLRELARPGSRACIVFTDSTRATPDDLLVPALLAELEAAGVRDEDITLLCGIGMHRPSTPQEKVARLGAAVVSRYRVIDSEPQNPAALVDLGTTQGGVPVQVHRAAVEADLLIASGIVAPPQ